MADFPYYELDGRRYPRLHHILDILDKPQLDAWRKCIGEEASEEISRSTQAIGNKLDFLIVTALTGHAVTLTRAAKPELVSAWTGWQRWRTLQPDPFEITSIQRPYVSALYGYGATPDFVQPLMVTDWKATNRIRQENWIQVHAEVPLIFHVAVWPAVKVRIVRLDKTFAEFEEVIQPFNQNIWETFMALKRVYLDWFGSALRIPQEVMA